MTKAGGVLFLVTDAVTEDLPHRRFSQAGVAVVHASAERLTEFSDAEIAGFGGMFVPDGPGVPGLVGHADVRRVLLLLHEKGAPIASVGRGPAVLLAAPPNSEGQWLFDGYRLIANADAADLSWRLDTALKAAGAVFDESSDVVVDRNLVTARNDDSAVVDAVLELMTVKGHR